MNTLCPPAFVSMPGGMEWIVIAMLGLLVFGRRLPEVSRSIGRSVVEFKKGLSGVADEDGADPNRRNRSGPQLPPAGV